MSNSETIRARDQIPQEDTWALEDLYPSDESWEQALSALTARQAEAAAFAGKLGESGETLAAFLHLVEDVDGRASCWPTTPMRKADQDTRNATYRPWLASSWACSPPSVPRSASPPPRSWPFPRRPWRASTRPPLGWSGTAAT